MARDVEKERLTEEQRQQAVDAAEDHDRIRGPGRSRLHHRGGDGEVRSQSRRLPLARAALPPETIFATNTSSISITRLAAATQRPAKFVGLHFFNPVPVMKLVEVVPGLQTAPETVEKAIALATSAGKTPVRVNDFPGFVSNRVLMPMINEAVFCLMEGVADAEGIDNVMKLGMNHPMGPLELADLIGLDVCRDIMMVLYESFHDSKYRPCPLLEKMVAAGWLGCKTQRGFYTYPRE